HHVETLRGAFVPGFHRWAMNGVAMMRPTRGQSGGSRGNENSTTDKKAFGHGPPLGYPPEASVDCSTTGTPPVSAPFPSPESEILVRVETSPKTPAAQEFGLTHGKKCVRPAWATDGNVACGSTVSV